MLPRGPLPVLEKEYKDTLAPGVIIETASNTDQFQFPWLSQGHVFEHFVLSWWHCFGNCITVTGCGPAGGSRSEWGDFKIL